VVGDGRAGGPTSGTLLVRRRGVLPVGTRRDALSENMARFFRSFVCRSLLTLPPIETMTRRSNERMHTHARTGERAEQVLWLNASGRRGQPRVLRIGVPYVLVNHRHLAPSHFRATPPVVDVDVDFVFSDVAIEILQSAGKTTVDPHFRALFFIVRFRSNSKSHRGRIVADRRREIVQVV
jgi:hypothetical protein